MQDVNFWIGATDIAEEDTWLWVTGAPVDMGMPFWGGVSIHTYLIVYRDTMSCSFISLELSHYLLNHMLLR